MNIRKFLVFLGVLTLFVSPAGAEVYLDGVSQSSGLGTGCGDNEIMKWDDALGSWQCEADSEGAGGADSDAYHDNVASEITATTAITALADADEFVLEDASDSNNKKAITAANLSAYVKTDAEDTFYTETEIDAGYQVLDADLTAIAALTCTEDQVISRTAGGSWECAAAGSGSLSASGTPVSGEWGRFTSGTVFEPLDDSQVVTALDILTTTAGAAAYQPLHAYLTDLAGVTANQGDILYFNGTDWVDLAPGTSGQFLETQGAAANPQWGDPAGSGDITAVGDAASGAAFTADGLGNSLYFEGSTANTFEVQVTAANPGADVTVTIPAETGSVLLGPAGLGTDNVLVRSNGTGNLTQATGIAVADTTNNISGIGTISSGAITSTAGIEGTSITGTSFVIGSADIAEAELEIIDGGTLSTADLNIIDGVSDTGTLTATELLYVDGVNFAIQDQIDAKADIAGETHTGTTTIANLVVTTSADLPSNVDLPAGTVDPADLADGDFGDFTVSTGVTSLDITGETAGDVLYYNGSSWIRLAKGTAGQVLEMNAGATAPEWDTDDGAGSVGLTGTEVLNDFAKFTDGTTLVGRSYAETKADLSLDNVDNTSDATKNAAAVTLTNKTIAVGSNTITGVVAATMGDADHGMVSWASSVATVEDFALAGSAYANHYDIFQVDKLEGFDAAVFVDLGADGIAQIAADTAIHLDAGTETLTLATGAANTIDISTDTGVDTFDFKAVDLTTTGDVTATNLVGAVTSANAVDSDQYTDGSVDSEHISSIVTTLSWLAAGLSTDGTNCSNPAEVTLNSGPKQYTISCADNDSSVVYGMAPMPDSWTAASTVTFEIQVYHATTETITFAGDFAAQCRGDGEIPSSTWGTAQSADVSITTAHQVKHATTAALTPAGTCAGGDTLWWKWTMDATTSDANAANTDILAVKMEYSSDVGD